VGMAVLAVVLIGLGFGLFHFHEAAVKMAAQEAALDRSIAKIRAEDVGYQKQMQQPNNAKVLIQAGFLNQLFEEKTFSWTAAMEDLERVLPGGVQVTAIEPSRDKTGKLTLRLRISGLREPSVQMVRNMERSRRFVAPRIAGENAENAGAGGDLVPVTAAARVSFDILAEYNPATLDERKAQIAAQKKVTPATQRAAAPIGAERPGYVAPNVAGPLGRPQVRPQAMRPQPMRPPMQRRMPGQPGIPIGVDLNGLRNHEGNRFRPGQAPPEGTIPQNGPGAIPGQQGGPQ